MIRRLAVFTVGALAAASSAFADFTYEQTSTMTGGSLMAMMRVVGAFSKQAREPIRSTQIVKGDKMATISQYNAHVIDLAAETITEIDFQKKQYSVMTFAEMKQFLDEMSRKMKSGDGDMNFKVSAEATGQTKKIAGYDAKQMIIKMEAEATDKKSGQSGAMNIVTDTWLASGIAGYKEVQDFHQRMAAKLNWTPGGGMMMNRPDISKGMAAVAKEMAKVDGVPILQIMRMGGASNLTPEQQKQMAEARQQQQQQPQQQQAEKPSAGSALGGALGGRLGRFGGLGKKKEQPAQEQAPAQSAQAQSQPAGGPPADPSVLMELTVETTNFSSGPADASKFEVPAGFKKVAKK